MILLGSGLVGSEFLPSHLMGPILCVVNFLMYPGGEARETREAPLLVSMQGTWGSPGTLGYRGGIVGDNLQKQRKGPNPGEER